MYIDTHAHLTDKAFDEDREEVLYKCWESGVCSIITSGFNLPSSKEALEFAKTHKNVFASVGVYPENILELDKKSELELANLAQEEKVVAIGEIGLQCTDNMPSRQEQEEGFLRQIKLAYEIKKPIVIHCRDAYGAMLEILKKNKNLLAYGGTLHCFSGSSEVAREMIKLGLHISVGGVSTFKNAEKLKNTLKELPLERLLLETDCPYLAPHPYRGKRNAPYYLSTTAENLAKIKEVSVEEIAIQTTLNAKELFKI